jgi:uncharacterized protein YecA (UPF0149 family)
MNRKERKQIMKNAGLGVHNVSTFFPSPNPPLKRDFKIGRNESCPCGSGKKYKHCCLMSGIYENFK